MSRGFFSYGDTLPPVREEGFEFATRLRLFGVIPTWIHYQRLTLVDHAKHELVMDERGGPYRSWQHRMRVHAIESNRCQHEDEIHVDVL